MSALGLSLALAMAALLGFAGLLLASSRLSGTLRVAVLAVCCAVGLVAHTGLVRWEAGGLAFQAPPAHPNEFLHYWIGTKYFSELGYTGLYRAVVVADSEDVPEAFRPDGVVRDLESYRLVSRGGIAAEPGRAKAAFTPERWAAFKQDVAVVRGLTVPEFWHASGWVADHGYNGSPVTTAISGGLANQRWLSPEVFVGLAQHLDLYLVILFGAALAGIEGALLGLAALLFLFANPLNDSVFIGGAYLRADYLVALGVALVALRKGWLATSGVAFALAASLRIFPLVFPALLLARDLLPRDRAWRLRERARLHAGFAIAGVAIFGATSCVETPGDRNPWFAFGNNLAFHSGTIGGNQIGLQVPLRYSSANDRRISLDRPRDAPVGWREEARRVLDARAPTRAAVGLALLGLALYGLWRGGDRRLLPAGLLVVFVAVPLAHYYLAILSLLALSLRTRREWLLGVATLIALCVTALPIVLRGSEDLRFTLMSLEILALLVGLLCWLDDDPEPALAEG